MFSMHYGARQRSNARDLHVVHLLAKQTADDLECKRAERQKRTRLFDEFSGTGRTIEAEQQQGWSPACAMGAAPGAIPMHSLSVDARSGFQARDWYAGAHRLTDRTNLYKSCAPACSPLPPLMAFICARRRSIRECADKPGRRYRQSTRFALKSGEDMRSLRAFRREIGRLTPALAFARRPDIAFADDAAATSVPPPGTTDVSLPPIRKLQTSG